MSIPYFDKTHPRDFGRIRYVGRDDRQDQVYVLGTKRSDSGQLLRELSSLTGREKDFYFVSTMSYVNPVLRLGGWLSRSLGLPAIGRPLVLSGIKMAFPALVNLANRAKVDAQQGGNQ